MPVREYGYTESVMPEWARSERYEYCDGFLEELYGNGAKKGAGWLKKLSAGLTRMMYSFFL